MLNLVHIVSRIYRIKGTIVNACKSFYGLGILGLLMLPISALHAQEIRVVQDLGLWSGLNVKSKITDNLTINLEQQVRFYTNISEFDDYLAEIGAKYKISKQFKLGGQFRYTYNARRWKDTEHNGRYSLQIEYGTRLSDHLKLSYRLRYQQEFINLLSHYDPSNIRFSELRNKVKVRYDLNEKNRLHGSVELFRLMELYTKPYFSKIRFYLGNTFKTKLGPLDMSLGYEQDINSNYPLSFFFLKSIYTFEL